MNSRRLSSTEGRVDVDEARLYDDIRDFLNRPSNYQITDKGT